VGRQIDGKRPGCQMNHLKCKHLGKKKKRCIICYIMNVIKV
jgi:hypothetical protein